MLLPHPVVAGAILMLVLLLVFQASMEAAGTCSPPPTPTQPTSREAA